MKMTEKEIVSRQQEFVAWLKENGIYNQWASSATMLSMQLVWETMLKDNEL